MNTSSRFKIHSLLARIGTWLLLLGILFLLRSFFLLLFLTFVFGFVQARGVDLLARYIPNRSLRAWIVGLALLGSLSGTVLFLTPNIKSQTSHFVQNFSTYLQSADREIDSIAVEYPSLSDVVTELRSGGSPTLGLLQQILGIDQVDDPNDKATLVPLLNRMAHMGGKVFGIASAFVLSLLFSFMIVLDLPNLQRMVAELEHSRLRFAFREFSPSIISFSQVLGHALEAQFFIAIINSLLTTVGLIILGLGNYWAFLATIVFLFSFVPVAGVFISSVPICLVALQFLGPHAMVMAIGMVIVIHLIEAYVLNPRIYGARMRINPVIVLLILTIGGKLFSFWGLVLGVPVYTWFVGYAIRKQTSTHPVIGLMP